MRGNIIQVEEKVSLIKGLPLSLQHLFAMFGASILVPTLFRIDPAIVLLMNGIGTLIYLVLCKGKAPAFLGSSFAFLSPVFVVLGADQAMWGANYSYALGGFIASGLIFCAVAVIIGRFGPGWIGVVLPPVIMGPTMISVDIIYRREFQQSLQRFCGKPEVRMISVEQITRNNDDVGSRTSYGTYEIPLTQSEFLTL